MTSLSAPKKIRNKGVFTINEKHVHKLYDLLKL